MRVAGHFNYAQVPGLVYQTFTDRDALLFATPGLQHLNEVAPDHWEAVLRAGVGGFYLVYQGHMKITDRVPGRSYRLLVEAVTQHGGQGRADLQLEFLPSPDGGTRLEYDADVELSGGQKLLPSLARGMVDFFLRGMAQWLKELECEKEASLS